MKIDIITIFPEMFVSPFAESIVKRAKEQNAIDISIYDLRNWTTDNHKTVDDRPYGGGPGMIMKVDVIDRALEDLCQNDKVSQCHKVLLSAKGALYTQQKAQKYSKFDKLILIAGHYEGVDERVAQHLVDEEIRIGNYVLTGGELPAMVVVDSVTRLLPGVLGNNDSSHDESHSIPGYLEYPQYTRPVDYKGWKVPEILLKGHHAEIAKWRKDKSSQTEK